LSKWFQTKTFLWEYPIESYVKLSSAVAAILVGGLKCWMCPGIPTSNQDVRQAKNRKKGRWNLEKSSLKILGHSQPNFAEMILGWSPSKIVSSIESNLGRRAEPPDIFKEKNHPMTISSKFSSY
jgi:hypothetical protein